MIMKNNETKKEVKISQSHTGRYEVISLDCKRLIWSFGNYEDALCCAKELLK